MSQPDPPPEPPSPLDLGRAAAARLGQAPWQLEAEPVDLTPDPEPPATPPEPPPVAPPATAPRTAAQDEAPPPPPERIVEAMLFVGGPPLTPPAVAAAVRGFTADRLRETVDLLNRTYRGQNRPYSIQARDAGYVLVVKPAYAAVRERLLGGTREARLSQPALDVLSLIAYRQPVTKPDIDALRGADSAAVLRQLVRLGLAVVSRRGEAGAREVCYGTTPRFLEVFGLSSLDDLPRLGDTQPV